MKKISRLFALSFFYCLLTCQILSAQVKDCNITSWGFTPINDLGTGTWNGWTGGLYPNGSNYRPSAHHTTGMSLAWQVEPLDANGNPDPVNGKIGFISIGMSNTNYEFGVFIQNVTGAVPNLNPKLQIVNCAKGGPDIDVAGDINSFYWDTVAAYLANGGLIDKQVQVIWLKHAQLNPNGGLGHIDSLYNKFIPVLQNIKIKFPNVKLCYMTSRIYSGYSTGTGNPEPYAYYNGWAVKQVIEDQINGSNPSLDYSAIPWLGWSYYPWADGTTPRSDGLTWICPTDYQPDGMHPNSAGQTKVANGLINFFSTDSTACPWFLTNCSISTTSVNEHSSLQQAGIYPNPSSGVISITGNKDVNGVEVFDMTGRKVFFAGNLTSERLDISFLENGVYIVKFVSGKNSSLGKIIINK